MGRKIKPARVIPGQFTADELRAAFELQDAGVPHPAIDDAAWSRIDAAWAAIPRIWGRGPWIDRSDLMVIARTNGDLRARVYRVTTEIWGLELDGTPRDQGVHRGDLDTLLALTVAAWPAAPPGADQPTPAQARAARAYTELIARTTHEAPKRALDWLAAPTVGPVLLPGFEGFAAVKTLTWEGGRDGAALTDAQLAAARVLVERGAEVRDALVPALLEHQRAFAREHDYPEVVTVEELLDGIAIKEIDLSRDARGGFAYVDISYEDDTTGLRGATILEARLVGLSEYGEKLRAPSPSGPTHASPIGGLDWIEAPSRGPVAFPELERFQGQCEVDWEGWDEGEPMTPAQLAAARVLATSSREVCDALTDGLYVDQRKHPEDGEFPRTRAPSALRKLVTLSSLYIYRDEKDGLAYVDLGFHSAWRTEHGLSAIMHGARLVRVGGWGDNRYWIGQDRAATTSEPGPTRTADGARTEATWLEVPHDAAVAFSMWEGLRGRWTVRFLYEDEDEVGSPGTELEFAL